MKVCEICGEPAHAKGLCKRHYQTKWRHDNRELPIRVPMTPEERKAAARARAKLWREQNPEKHRSNVAKHRAKTLVESRRKTREYMRERLKDPAYRESSRIKSAEWRATHPKKNKKSHADYYERHKEGVQAKNRNYRKAHADQYRRYGREYKAMKRANGSKLPKGTIEKMMVSQHGKCIVCHTLLSKSGYHIDHIIPVKRGGPHCVDNLQLLCPSCNRHKSAKNMIDFMQERGLLL